MVTDNNVIEIGAFEAKNRLSELLRGTEAGKSFVITRRGRAVARLVPAKGQTSKDLQVLQQAFVEFRDGIEGTMNVRELVEEGRRW
jgi:prevent-host-death family protein